MATKSEYITKFINFYANKKIRERGKLLLKNNAIKRYEYNEDIDTYIFEIQGSSRYKTKIINLKIQNLSTSCTCPFTYGVICKHTVAALLALKNKNLINIQKTESKLKPKPKRIRKKVQPVIINDYKNITIDLIKENTSLDNIKVLCSNYDIDSVKIFKHQIVFKVIKDSFYNYKVFEVKFEHKNNKLYITTDDNSRAYDGQLKKTEITCLLHIINTKSNKMFDKVFNNYEKIKQECTTKYGLKPQEFDEYFYFNYDIDDGFQILKRNKAQGLLPLDDIETEYKDVFNKLTEPKKTELYLSKPITQEKIIGFALKKDDDNQYKYIVFAAKPNKAKTKLLSKFETGYNNNDVLITENQNQIIGLIKELNECFAFDQYYFNLSKKIFKKLAKEQFVFLLNENHYYIRKNSIKEIYLEKTPATFVLNISSDDTFIMANLVLKIGNNKYLLNEIDLDNSGNFIFYHDNFLIHLENYKDVILYHNFSEGFKIVKERKDLFFKNIIQPLSKNYKLIFEDNTFNHQKIKLDYKKEQVFLSEKEDYIIIQPQVVYDNETSVVLTNNGNYIYQDTKTNTIIEYERNYELETDFINQIAELHSDFEEQKKEKYFYLSYDDFTKDFWFYNFFDKLNALGIEIFGLKNLKNFKYSPFKGKVTTSIKSGEDWFDVSVDVSFGNNSVSISDIKRAVINQKKYIQLKDGSVGILPEKWLHKLEKYFRNGEIKDNKLAISKLKYNIIDELFDNINETEILEEIANKRKKIANFKEISKTKVPVEIKATLRDYQKEGLNWLNFLDEMGWGGILADDMGLGKTLQILTFIQHIIKKNKTPNLIVLPTSLLFNWKAEIEKFAPKIRYYFHYGSDRSKSTKKFNKNHIVFTTYGTLLRDIEFLNKFQFNYVILDESQAIKNPTSRRYKAVNLIKAKNRIALTGTPIENSTFDLFAQMNFVNPGFFGSINNFKVNYSNPIDKDRNENIASELQRLINPFILRRTKEKVAKELPPKTEDVLYCEMEPEQQRIYDLYKNNYRNKLLKNVEQKGIGKSKLMVLKALTRLRQICDSPKLIEGINYTNKSIKIQEIINHITQKTAKHKILLFSQFVEMLNLIKNELDVLNIKYEYLDGKSNSKQRENSVFNFQNNPDLRVFLISLKAGGTGLNLTAADYVYIIDPWWNPAVENQAIDRCYRIGQNKTVFAYRMICKNTIEEKILNLQSKKRKLASDIIHTDENMIKNLSVDDIKNLFG